MSTTALPRRARRTRRRLLIGGGLLVALLVGGLLFWRFGQAAPAVGLPEGWTVAEANTGSIDATVSATGNVEPEAQADLRFEVSGTVKEILVKPGQQVAAGEALARIDPTNLELQLAKAQADLATAQADYDELKNGATPEDVAEAEAAVVQAQGQFQETAGSVTEADIAAARSRLNEAQAKLAELQGGPKATELATSQAALDRTRAQYDQEVVALQQTRDERSKAKTDAERKLQETTVALEKAQSEYSAAYWRYQNVQDKGREPSENKGVDNPELSDYGNLTAQEAFRQAELDLQNAQLQVEQAQKDLETARQAEITALTAGERQIAAAEAQIREAEADLTELTNGADADELASAQAQVADAQAQLDQLVGQKRSGSLQSAEAGVRSAQARLDALLADPKTTELARRQAAVERAKADVDLAQREIGQATLVAPFDGTVASVGLEVGEPASGGTSSDSTGTAVAVADLRKLHVDVPIDELDIGQVTEGQTVRLALDALPGQAITGTVERIAPLATTEEQGTRTYEVTVAIDGAAQGVRPGMTAVVEVITEQRPEALLLPRRAIVVEGTKSYVLKPVDGGQPTPDGTPANERVEVQTGLSNNESVEILSGLQPGDTVLVQDVVETFNPMEN